MVNKVPGLKYVPDLSFSFKFLVYVSVTHSAVSRFNRKINTLDWTLYLGYPDLSLSLLDGLLSAHRRGVYVH